MDKAVHLDEVIDDNFLHFDLVNFHSELVQLGQVLSQQEQVYSHFFISAHKRVLHYYLSFPRLVLLFSLLFLLWHIFDGVVVQVTHQVGLVTERRRSLATVEAYQIGYYIIKKLH